MAEAAKRLTADQCREKAVECLEIAAVARDTSHKVMLEHMAETWERIAREINQRQTH
jgi:hypothetical protein